MSSTILTLWGIIKIIPLWLYIFLWVSPFLLEFLLLKINQSKWFSTIIIKLIRLTLLRTFSYIILLFAYYIFNK